jgi:hypothetical protein
MSTEDKYSKLSKGEKYDVNPFWDILHDTSNYIEARKKELTTKQARYDSDGIFVGTDDVGTGDYAYYFHDGNPFIKCYTEELNLGKLKTDGLKMLDLIFKTLKPKQDFVFISASQYMALSGSKSRTAYYNGIKDLVENNIIRISLSANMFFINPAMIFNGERTTKLNNLYDAESEYNRVKKYGGSAKNLKQ